MKLKYGDTKGDGKYRNSKQFREPLTSVFRMNRKE